MSSADSPGLVYQSASVSATVSVLPASPRRARTSAGVLRPMRSGPRSGLPGAVDSTSSRNSCAAPAGWRKMYAIPRYRR